MPSKKRTRESKYTKNFGTKPSTGRRYVLNGKVRIEWYDEEGKRRSRTIGDNTAEVRKHADEALEEILDVLEPKPMSPNAPHPPDSMEQALRALGVSVLDFADLLAEYAASFGSGIAEQLRKPVAELEEGEVPPELPEAEVVDDDLDEDEEAEATDE
ncbi:MAG: hypothetical protein JSW51_02015 [Gemmatimonadota bacterium]|nr:MAG: hypothetical protein JSW51_02015 [Gemmatimonadota bacterium]